jgi:hypothetical protein
MNIWKLSTVVTGAVLTLMLACEATPVAQAQVAQPHMAEAVRLLRAARAELAVSAPNKGGHREVAIQRTDEAIAQTLEGIEYARAHGGE